ncbi:MAG: YitT family protein [Candidatus Fimadaptatus sp.]
MAEKFKTAVLAFFGDRMNLKRAGMTVFGVFVCALSVGFFNCSMFGADPFQCFANGLDKVIPLSFGTLYMIISIVMLLFVFIMDRHFIGLGTFINLFLTGYVVQFSTWLLGVLLPDPTLATRIVFLVIGVVVMCFASAIYFTADLGVSVYDAIALHLDKKLPIPFRIIRICTDLICVGIGFALGAVVGVGTLITALFMGPLIDVFNRTVARPFLYGREAAKGQGK